MRALACDDWDPRALDADLRVFTSPAAIRATLARGVALHARRPALVVGARSAAVLREAGFTRVAIADSPGIESLLAHPWLHDVGAQRISVFTAPEGRGDWRALRARAAELRIAHVYQRHALALRPAAIDTLVRHRGPLAVIASSEALLRQTWRALPLQAQRVFTHATIVLSSARLATVARSLGFTDVHIAAGPSPTVLAELAAQRLRGLA